MNNGQDAGVGRGIRAIWGAGSVGGMTDGQLLDRFVERRDEAGELAFEALVGRHGPMVLRVARDVLRDPHSAEDAFQATFLVLARKARSIARPEALGPWLHGVAHRVARKARVEADRRRRHENRAAERAPRSTEPDFGPGDIPTRKGLHDEVARLPAPCRVAVVLCYFEGLTYDQAARRLGVTEATVRGRLARARRSLKGSLAARGAAAWSLPIVPGRWIGPTARAASRFARGIPGETPARVAGLAEGVSRTMTISPLKAAAATLLVAFHLVAVAAVLAGQRQGPAVEPPGATRPDGTAPAVDEPARLPLTLDQAIDRLIREDGELRSKFFEIPQAKADVLTAGLRANPAFYADALLVPYGQYSRSRPGGPTQYDVNISLPLDLTRKRRERAASALRATRVIEAQYVDAVRLRIDALCLAFGEALAARDLAGLRREAVGRLDRLEGIAREEGTDAAGLRPIGEARRAAEGERRKAAVELDRCSRKVASSLAIEGDDAGRVEVVGELGREEVAIPPAEALVAEALAHRPDLAAYRLGLIRAKLGVLISRGNLFVPFLLDLPPVPNRAATGRAKLNVAQSQVELSNLEGRVASEVGDARRECVGAVEALSEAGKDATAARQALDASWARFEDGSRELAGLLMESMVADAIARQRIEASARAYRSRVAINTAVGARSLGP